jgi:microcystin-dependent protein
MACVDCFNGCGDPTSDKCVKYTGENIPLFDICKGDPLSKLNDAIVEALLSALDGTGIILKDVTLDNAPSLLTVFKAKSKTLVNLVQLLIDNQQTLKNLIDSIKPPAVSFNTACLTGLPANPTPNQILASTVNLLCGYKTIIDVIPTTYVKLSDLPTLVKEITYVAPDNDDGSGNTVPQEKDKMLKFVAYEYYGSLSNFDSVGKGLASAGYDKIFLCNGLNGTPDKRGRVTVGAVKNVPGGTLDSVVNPNSSVNSPANVNYGIGDKVGENFHTLLVKELPAHTHTIVDPGHTHEIATSKDDASGGGQASVGANTPEGQLFTQVAKTNITIGSTGNGVAVSIRQPSIAAAYIMYIP